MSCNACPVEFPNSLGTPLVIKQGGPISLGIRNSNLRFFKSSINIKLLELFLRLFLLRPKGLRASG